MATLEEEADLSYARATYERLLFQQPHVRVGGLWRLAPQHFAIQVAALPGARTRNGLPLADWFNSAARVAGTWVELLSTIPVGAAQVAERTADERALLNGAVRTEGDVALDLSLELPSDFPAYSARMAFPTLILRPERHLAQAEEDEGRAAVARMGSGFGIQFEPPQPVQLQSMPSRPPNHQSFLYLTPARRLRGLIPDVVESLYEEDQEVWRTTRQLKLGDMTLAEILPAPFRDGGSAALVSAASARTSNVRVPLLLHQRVVIDAPMRGDYEAALQGLGATEDELVALAAAGRLQFLLPRSPEQYPASLLGRLGERAPNSLLFSRKLAAAAVVDSHRRLPLLYPGIGSAERANLLSLWYAEADGWPHSELRAATMGLLEGLGSLWCIEEETVHRAGAMGAPAMALAVVVGEIFHRVTQQDRQLELSVTSPLVTWAGALGATIYAPEVAGNYAQVGAELMASIYSGVPAAPAVAVSLGSVGEILDGLLAFENDMPLKDLEDTLREDEISRLRALVSGLAASNIEAEAIKGTIADFNRRVRTFERRAENLSSIDLVGLLPFATAILTGDVRSAAAVSLAGWLLGRLLPKLDETRVSGRLLDSMRGALTLTPSDVVLVSRLRRRLKS